MARLFLLIFAVLLAGCRNETKEPPPADYLPLFRTAQQAVEPAGAGDVSWSFNVTPGVTSIQVIAEAPGNAIAFTSLRDPRGRMLRDVAVDETAGYQPSPLTIGYPLLSSESLMPGRYTITVRLRTGSSSSVAFRLITRIGPAPGSGVLRLNVFYIGSITTAQNSREAISEALDRCAAVFKDAGISLTATEHELPEAPSIMPDPYEGDPLYEELAKVADPGVNIYMAVNAPGQKDEFQYVTAGSMPGPMAATRRSAIVVRTGPAAGPDGLFNAPDDDKEHRDFPDDDNEGDEIQLLADNICHELFHYLGLPNVVDFEGNDVIAADPFDTPKCASRNGCEREKKVRENVMYPEVLRGNSSSGHFFFYPRNQIVLEQARAAKLYVGVGQDRMQTAE